MDKKIRFLKKITIYNLIMATIVTFVFLYVCYIAKEPSGSVAAALCSLWGVELGLSALIKVSEKDENEKKDEGSI